MMIKEITQCTIIDEYLQHTADLVHSVIHISTHDQEYYFFCDNKTWSKTDIYAFYGKLVIEPISDIPNLYHIYNASIYYNGYKLSLRNMQLINREEYESQNVA